MTNGETALECGSSLPSFFPHSESQNRMRFSFAMKLETIIMPAAGWAFNRPRGLAYR